jgi:hypothetical protein
MKAVTFTLLGNQNTSHLIHGFNTYVPVFGILRIRNTLTNDTEHSLIIPRISGDEIAKRIIFNTKHKFNALESYYRAILSYLQVKDPDYPTEIDISNVIMNPVAKGISKNIYEHYSRSYEITEEIQAIPTTMVSFMIEDGNVISRTRVSNTTGILLSNTRLKEVTKYFTDELEVVLGRSPIETSVRRTKYIYGLSEPMYELIVTILKSEEASKDFYGKFSKAISTIPEIDAGTGRTFFQLLEIFTWSFKVIDDPKGEVS